MPETVEIVREDRFSALSDDLLVKILMSIPTKDAVRTMILSKRLRFIWTLLPWLEFKDDHDINSGDDESKKSVWWFLNKSMEFHKAPNLEVLIIKLGPLCPNDADLGKVVENAVSSRVFRLSIKLKWSANPTRLPKSLYSCKTLDQLELSRKILVDFPSCSCLPFLRILKLHYVLYEDETSIVRFLSSCPVLEYLSVKRNKNDNVAKFSINVPSLQILFYYNYNTSWPDENDVYTDRSLVINTPALTEFHIKDDSQDSCLIENMPCLKYASVWINSFTKKFLTSISMVSSLFLVLTTEMSVMALCCPTIKFSRLIKYKITPCNSDWLDSLPLLLHNTPKLKFLLVDYRCTDEPPNASPSWRKLSSIPDCLSSSLEEFTLIDYGGTEEQEELVEYILHNSKCLKTATIVLKSTINLEDKDTMKQKLKAIHRVSLTSQLLFES